MKKMFKKNRKKVIDKNAGSFDLLIENSRPISFGVI
jgi:hypothetical protein